MTREVACNSTTAILVRYCSSLHLLVVFFPSLPCNPTLSSSPHIVRFEWIESYRFLCIRVIIIVLCGIPHAAHCCWFPLISIQRPFQNVCTSSIAVSIMISIGHSHCMVIDVNVQRGESARNSTSPDQKYENVFVWPCFTRARLTTIFFDNQSVLEGLFM